MSAQPPESRTELRLACARTINNVPISSLRERYGISRIGNITGLDTIGVPVYTAVRPLGKSISISAGKGLNPVLVRAGAIAEAIELELAEKPVGPFRIAAAFQIPEEDRLELADCFPMRRSSANDLTIMAWEEATNIQTGERKLVPSDLVWMTTRITDQPFMYLQMTSNGLASGFSEEDAILSGLYEIIERDAWTLNQFLIDNLGVFPKRTRLTDLPVEIEEIKERIEGAGARLHLFDITTNFDVPVFSALILDLSGGSAGTFAGYGAHLDAQTAALRAITEAVQARACYIAGARDDLFRRQFLLMKRLDAQALESMFSDLALSSPLAEYRQISFPDVRAELRYLLKLVKSRGANEVYVKEIGSALDDALKVVRVISPQLEPIRFDHWTPGLRCLSWAKRKMAQLAKQAEEPEETKPWEP